VYVVGVVACERVCEGVCVQAEEMEGVVKNCVCNPARLCLKVAAAAGLNEEEEERRGECFHFSLTFHHKIHLGFQIEDLTKEREKNFFCVMLNFFVCFHLCLLH